jgi:hypothetical protein
MPEPTIDLQRDCELFVDFDTDYFDSQRDKILDRSGNGRHPVASGGPTLGANGPDNFEAVSFDGSDDLFNSPGGFENAYESMLDNGGFTITLQMKITQSSVSSFPRLLQYGQATGGPGRVETNGAKGLVLFVVDTTGANVSVGVGDATEFTTYTFVHRPNKSIDSFKAGELQDSVDFPNDVSAFAGAGQATPLRGDKVSYDMSNLVFHSRPLSDAEIEYLNRLTEPRRAQL